MFQRNVARIWLLAITCGCLVVASPPYLDAGETSLQGIFVGKDNNFVVASSPFGFFWGQFDPLTASAVWTNFNGSISNQTTNFELIHEILPNVYTYHQTVLFTGGTGDYAGTTGAACFEGIINLNTGSYIGIINGAVQQLIFETDFDSGIPAEFAGATTTEPVGGYQGVGAEGNEFSGLMLRNASGDAYAWPAPEPIEVTTITLTDLPPHESIDLKFLLAVIDSWDGFSGNEYGPEYFNVSVDGTVVFSETFSNWTPQNQTYSGEMLLNRTDVAFGLDSDSAYEMGSEPALQAIPHTADTLTIEFYASGPGTQWEGGANESWGIDNLSVALNR